MRHIPIFVAKLVSMFSKAVFDQKLPLFIEDLETRRYELQLLYPESLDCFQSHWDREARDMVQMLDNAFDSKISHRLWRGVDYFPKEMVMKFASLYPHLLREVFDDLFDENKEVLGRVGRLSFHMDELLNMLIEDEPKKTWRSHYHDAFVSSIYLTFKYPEMYTFYLPDLFCKAMPLLGARKEVSSIAVDSYFTIMRTMNKLIHQGQSGRDDLKPPFAALELLFWITNERPI